MMISALAKGAQILGEPRYADAARSAANFLQRTLWDESRGVLLRRYRDGEALIDGFLDDYALAILAFLDLYETRFDPAYFAMALHLAEKAIALFEDREKGGFFSTTGEAGDLVLRLKDDYDGAEPSGNSTMALALLRLARMTDRADFRQAAERTLEAFASRLTSGGAGVPQMLVALQFMLAKPREIVLAGPKDSPAMRELLTAIRRRFLPTAVLTAASEVPHPMPAIEDRPTAYVCENFACKLPTCDPSKLDELLQ
jgi:uncharacterized protein YyaL (SSP411 family)